MIAMLQNIEILYSKDNNNYISIIIEKIITSQEFNMLENNIEYTFIIKTIDTSGNISQGKQIKKTPGMEEISNITITESDSKIILNWQNPDKEDYDGIVIIIDPLVSNIVQPIIVDKNLQNIEISEMTNNVVYAFTIKTKYIGGNVTSGISLIGKPDGLSWEEVKYPPFSLSVEDIAFGNNKFVAVGQRGVIAYSDNAQTWTNVTSSSYYNTPYWCVSFVGDKFIAGQNGAIGYSDNAQTWTYSTISFANAITDFAFGNEKYVVVSTGGKIGYSNNGISWSAVTDSTFGTGSPGMGTSDILAVAFGADKFVAVGSQGKIAYSLDGITWSSVSTDIFNSASIQDICFNNNMFIALDRNGNIVSSNDGISWEKILTVGLDENVLGSPPALDFINFVHDRYIIGGKYGKMAYSFDCINWKPFSHTTFEGTNSFVQGITYGNNIYVAVGTKNGDASWVPKIAFAEN
jgi:hypothetical protein